MTMDFFNPAWWHAAGQRAAYTALAALLPLAALLFTRQVTPLYVLSVVALAALVSLVTSLAGLPEVSGKAVPWWRAITVRVLKTAGQVAAPTLASVGLLEDVGWYELGVTVAGAALTTLVRALMTYLPEDASAEPALAPRNAGGSYTLTELPFVGHTGEVVARRLEIVGPDGQLVAHATVPEGSAAPRHRSDD